MSCWNLTWFKLFFQATVRALKEADNWSTLSTEIEDAMDGGDLALVSEKLSAIQNSLKILSHVQDYDNRVNRYFDIFIWLWFILSRKNNVSLYAISKISSILHRMAKQIYFTLKFLFVTPRWLTLTNLDEGQKEPHRYRRSKLDQYLLIWALVLFIIFFCFLHFCWIFFWRSCTLTVWRTGSRLCQVLSWCRPSTRWTSAGPSSSSGSLRTWNEARNSSMLIPLFTSIFIRLKNFKQTSTKWSLLFSWK